MPQNNQSDGHSRILQSYQLEVIGDNSRSWSLIWQEALDEDKGEIMLQARSHYPKLTLHEVHDRLLDGTI